MPTKLEHGRRRSRAKHVLGVIGAVVAATVTFTTAAAAAVVVHLDVPTARRLVATQVTTILGDTLAGKVQIERIDHLGLDGLRGVQARVVDPDGVQVLHVVGVDAKIHAVDIAKSALLEKGPIRIAVDVARVGHADVEVSADATGKELRLAKAFAPRDPKPEPAQPEKPGRGVLVEAPVVELGHLWAHGTPPGAPLVDAEIGNLRALAHVDPKVTRATIAQVDLEARALPKPGETRGRLTGDVVLPAPNGQAFAVDATYAGKALGLPVKLDGHTDGKRVDAVLDARAEDPAGITALVGEGIQLREAPTAHVEVHGDLPDLDAVGHVALGRGGRVDIRGRAHLGEDGMRASARVAARHVDLSKILPSGPASDLGLDAQGDIALVDGIARGTVAVDTLPGTLQGDAVPRVVVRGEIDGPRGSANVRVLGDTVPMEADLALFPEAGDRVVEADIRAVVPELARLPGPLAVAKGRASVRATGRVALDAMTASARVSLLGDRIEASGQRVREVNVLASVQGPLKAPIIAVGARAEGVDAGGFVVPSVAARTTVVLGEGGTVVLRDAHVDANREEVHVGVSAARVALGGPEIRVEGGVVDGLGKPLRADVSKRGDTVRLAVDAPEVDLARVAAFAGKADDIRSGKLSLVTDLSIAPHKVDGSVKAKVANASVKTLDGGALELEADVHDRNATVGLSFALGKAGYVKLSARDIAAAGDPSLPGSWGRASGAVDVDGDIDLAKLRELVPGASERLSELSGRLTVRGAVNRSTEGARPDVRVHVKTRGLTLAGPVHEEPPMDGVEVTSVAPYRSENLDVEADVSLNAQTDEAEVAFRAIDQTSVIVALDVKATLPVEALLAGEAPRPLLERTPVSARLVVPERALSKMPAFFGVASVSGNVGLDLEAWGTIRDPRVLLVARGRGVRSPAFGVAKPADADMKLAYDGHHADLDAALATDGGKAHVTSRIDLVASALFDAAPGTELPWRGGAKVELASFPLGSIGAVANRRVHGRASGSVELTGLHEDAKLQGHIDLADLAVGGSKIGKGVIDLGVKDGAAQASVRFDQQDGFIDLKAQAGLAWGKELAPTPDPARPLEATLGAKAFRLSVLGPFVTGPVNGLDGRLDGSAKVHLEDGKDPRLEGTLAIRDTRAQVTALGQELKDIRAKVDFQPNGVIRVTDVLARGLTGEMRADATVRLQGMKLAGATANFEIPQSEKFDLALQGQPLGQVWTKAKIDVTAKPGTNDLGIVVDIPKLGFILPESTKSGVQELGPPEKVRVGMYKSPGRFVKLPLDRADVVAAKRAAGAEKAPTPPTDPTSIEIVVKLREGVIERGNMARVVIEGEPHVLVGQEETAMSGQIRVREGKVDVRGKVFEVERGTVTFTGEPANPTVVASASWEAADGTQVFADFVGPVKTGKVNLRSEPQRPQNEILALVLFGTADGANPTPRAQGANDGGAAKTAVGLGGGLAAQGLTEALDDLAGIQAQARVDTTSSNNPRPELEVQLTPKISLEVSHVLGTPPIAEPDKNYVSFDWRFRRNWSLETTFGDRGRAMVDAVWQKRY